MLQLVEIHWNNYAYIFLCIAQRSSLLKPQDDGEQELKLGYWFRVSFDT